jgi:hypothetical protein
MAREPDNLVLQLLREMRSDLVGMRDDIAGVKTRLDGIDKKMDEHHYLMTHTFGVAGMANVQTGLVDAKVGRVGEPAEGQRCQAGGAGASFGAG